MGVFTTFLNLYKPGGGSTGLILPDEVADVDRFNTNTDLIDAFAASWGDADERNHQLYGPAASLGAVTGMKRGDTYQESDSAFRRWRYNGTSWESNEGGLFLLRPSAVSSPSGSVTVSTEGAVVFSGASPRVQVDGVLSSRFSRYRIAVNVDAASSATDLYFAYRAGGAYAGPGNTTDWIFVETGISTGPTRASGTNQGHVAGALAAVQGAMANFELQGAATTSPKLVTGSAMSWDNKHRTFGGRINVAGVMDGFAIGSESGVSIGGSLKIYGYA